MDGTDVFAAGGINIATVRESGSVSNISMQNKPREKSNVDAMECDEQENIRRKQGKKGEENYNKASQVMRGTKI
ncbi:unnamed protein product [Nippostrongylus brasiliensis]|uniref:Gag-pol polyprotein n=1 Tax=Nippostrongylus brasiliensis TaxID=27835 RepID=A0A0N4XJR8_NIPBR|nr:unnamed protein product [Nippostrongylus brasiliensis]